jgi:hypothetical protein
MKFPCTHLQTTLRCLTMIILLTLTLLVNACTKTYSGSSAEVQSVPYANTCKLILRLQYLVFSAFLYLLFTHKYLSHTLRSRFPSLIHFIIEPLLLGILDDSLLLNKICMYDMAIHIMD